MQKDTNKEKTKYHSFHMVLDEETYNKLRKVAFELNVPKSEIIRIVLAPFLKQYEEEAKKKSGKEVK